LSTYNFRLVNLDTDSISVAKPDGSLFSQEEMKSLICKLNALLPSKIRFEDDGIFSRVIVLKAKNYILLRFDEKKGKDVITLKGSGLKDSKKEPALKALMDEVIDALLYQKDNLQQIYNKYKAEALDVQDITRWSTKKTVSKKLLSSERKNETDVVAALEGLDLREGDKYLIYNAVDGTRQIVVKGEPQFYKKTGLPKTEPNTFLKRAELWTKGDEDKDHLLERIWKTLEIFSAVIDLEKIRR
jgi:hypothetical protein